MRRLLPCLLAVLALTSACGESTSSAVQVADAPVDSTVETGTVTLRLRSVGPADAARTTIVVHGGPGLSADAMAAYDALAGPDRRVVGWDQRGSGRSSAPSDGVLGIAAHVADLEAVRDALGADAVDVIGQSWGGAIAAAYAATHPQRVSSLVLVGAVPLDVGVFRAGQARFQERTAVEQAAGAVPDPLPPADDGSCLDAFRALLPVYLHDDGRATDVRVDTCSAVASTTTYEAFVDDPAVVRLGAELAGYRGPALVIAGRHDAFGLAWLDRIVELLVGADVRRLVLEDAGHLVVTEAPDVVLAEIAAVMGR
jgi:pimeloyl-ACP methyl ester carboxylesterase